MKSFYLIFLFIFFINCSFNENKVSREKPTTIDYSKNYTFKEYTDLLIKNSENADYPDINNVPD